MVPLVFPSAIILLPVLFAETLMLAHQSFARFIIVERDPLVTRRNLDLSYLRLMQMFTSLSHWRSTPVN